MKYRAAHRVPKSVARQIADLKDHLDNLESAKKRYDEGNRAAYKDILTNLRTLLGRGPSGHNAGLLLKVMSRYSIQVSSETDSGKLTFDQFLAGKQVLNARSISHIDFVWELASQDAAHSDDGLAPEFAMGEQVSVGGVPINVRIIIMIADWTLGAGRVVVSKFRLADGSSF